MPLYFCSDKNRKNMKKIALTLILSIALVAAFAGNDKKSGEPSKTPAQTVTLSGNVVDVTSGEALTGVEITIEGTNIKTYTDFDGNYSISDMKPGKYNIIASFISYDKSLVEDYNAEKSMNEVDIKLQSSK